MVFPLRRQRPFETTAINITRTGKCRWMLDALISAVKRCQQLQLTHMQLQMQIQRYRYTVTVTVADTDTKRNKQLSRNNRKPQNKLKKQTLQHSAIAKCLFFFCPLLLQFIIVLAIVTAIVVIVVFA